MVDAPIRESKPNAQVEEMVVIIEAPQRRGPGPISSRGHVSLYIQCAGLYQFKLRLPNI